MSHGSGLIKALDTTDYLPSFPKTTFLVKHFHLRSLRPDDTAMISSKRWILDGALHRCFARYIHPSEQFL
jgi:hypothetical protein